MKQYYEWKSKRVTTPKKPAKNPTQYTHYQQIDNFEIYPNPNNGQFVVAAKLAQEKDVEIQVYNTLGQLITKSILKNVSVINEEINISNTSSGMYYINILSDNEIQTKIISKK